MTHDFMRLIDIQREYHVGYYRAKQIRDACIKDAKLSGYEVLAGVVLRKRVERFMGSR